jgi:hypothetical protein
MNPTTTVYNGHIILNPDKAAEMGLNVPRAFQGLTDFILAYDRGDDLIAWGPENERDQILNILRAY